MLVLVIHEDVRLQSKPSCCKKSQFTGISSLKSKKVDKKVYEARDF